MSVARSFRPSLGKALLVPALLLVACTAPGPATAPEPAGPTADLTWAAGERDVPTAKNIAAGWNRAHPEGPTVRIAELPSTSDDQHQQLATELNAGLGDFDVLSLDLIWTGEFASKGWLADLDDVREPIEQASLPGAVQSATWDGRLWAAPFTTDAGLLFYRKDLLGTTPVPTTWSRLEQLGQQVGRQNGIAPYVADGAGYEGLTVQYLEYLRGAGGDLFGPDCQVELADGPARQAAAFMQNARRSGFYAPGFESMYLDDAQNTFQSGRAVFLRGWPSMFRQMNDPASSAVAGKVGVARLPTFTGTGSGAVLGGHNNAVSAFSNNVEGAREFVRYVSTTPEVQRYLAAEDYAPTMKRLYDDPAVASGPVLRQLGPILPAARPRLPTPQWTSISEQVQQQILTAYTSDKLDLSPDIALLRDFLRATGPQC